MADKSSSIGEQIKSGLKGIHGAGEAIRGTFNETVDHTFDEREGVAKNHAIAEKGIADVKAADDKVGHHHGVKTTNPSGATTHAGLPGKH